MHKSVVAQERISDTGLTKEELQRYSRHLIMPEVTAEGQKRLKAARVLCIGAGGLGSPAALYLAAAGGVVLAGLWGAVTAWHRRMGLAHLLSLLVTIWGAGLVAKTVLDRSSYAKHPAVWTCP